MPQRIPKKRFNGGELSPLLDGRDDIEKYHSGLKIAQNINIQREGPFHGRAGFKLAGDAKSASNTRLEGFNIKLNQDDDTADGIILEFSPLKIRFWKRDGTQIPENALPFAAPLEVDTLYSATDINELDFGQKNNVIVITHPDHHPRLLRNFSDGSWTFDPIEWRNRPYTPLNVTPTTMTINASDQLEASANTFDSSWVGSYVRLQHPVDEPVITFSFWNVWFPYVLEPEIYSTSNRMHIFDRTDSYRPGPGGSFSDRVKFQVSGSFLSPLYSCIADYDGSTDSTGSSDPADYPTFFKRGIVAIGPVIVPGKWEFETRGAWRGIWNIERSFNDGDTWETVVTVTSDNDNNEDVSGDQTQTKPALFRVVADAGYDHYKPNIQFRRYSGKIEDEVLITSLVGGSTTLANITKDPDAVCEKATTDWSDDAFSDRNGYPICNTFFETRLFFGGTKADPERVMASRTNDFFNFSFGTLPDGAFSKPLNSNRFGSIVWMCSHQNLLIGTTDAEWASFSQEGGLLTPEDSNFRVHTYHGSDPNPGMVLSDSAVFVQRQGRKIREFAPAPVGLGIYSSPDLTELAEHITRGGIKQITRRMSPETELLALRNDGVITSMVFERTQNLYAWTKFISDGASGNIISIASTSGAGEDGTVFIAVERTIAGATATYIEMLHPESQRAEESARFEDFVYLDHAQVFKTAGGPYTALNVGTAYNGEELTVTGDGEDHGEFTVAGGVITLGKTLTNAVAGYRYTMEAEIMTPEIYGHGNKISTNSAHVSVKDSYSLKIGTTKRDQFHTETFSTTTPTSTARVITIPGFTNRGESVVLRQDRPLPLTVQTLDLQTNAGTS
tara:strand:+ start:2654 stop:5182 length:2529 start_codon:yes stop_codon:yes gene_type:complete